jgi:hypothetical protein
LSEIATWRVARTAAKDKANWRRDIDMLTILLIILIVLFLTGGGYGYSRRGRL